MKNSASLSVLQDLIAPRKNSHRRDRLPRKSALLSGILLLLFAVAWSRAVAFCQSQSASQQSPSSQQSESQTQSQQKKEDSPADAAKKTQKDKPKPKKVYTEEDLSGMRGNGVSVVGDESAKAGKSNNEASQQASDPTKSVKDEEYWRGRASKLRQQMAGVDEAIKNLKEEIKKNGPTGFDASTGLKDNVIYIDDRNARLKQLEQRRQDLDKQMDLLQEEGRKAGASPSWFR